MDVQHGLPPTSYLRAVIDGHETLLELPPQSPSVPLPGQYQLVLKRPDGEHIDLDGYVVQGGNLSVDPTMSWTQVKQIVGTAHYNTGSEANAPWGVGVQVHFKPGLYEVGTLKPSTQTSLTAPAKGSVVLKFTKHSTVTEDTAVILPLSDRKSLSSVQGKGRINNIYVNGNNNDSAAVHAFKVHGYWAVTPEDSNDSGECHTMFESEFVKCKGDGIRVDAQHQFVGFRMKASGNNDPEDTDSNTAGLAARFTDMHDGKLFAPGFSGGTEFNHCATPKVFGGDFFLPNDGSKPWTLRTLDQARLEIFGTEISGRQRSEGKNNGTGTRYDFTGNKCIGVNYKIDDTLTPVQTYRRSDGTTVSISCTIYLEDIDGWLFDTCTLIYNHTVPEAAEAAATPQYAIQVGSKTGDLTRCGQITMRNAAGMIHRRGRSDAVDTGYRPIVAWTKKFCNRMDLIDWDFTPGAVEVVRYAPLAVPPIPLPDTHVLPGTYAKADYPLGYEFFTGGAQDDGVANFTVAVPAGFPAAPAGHTYAFRMWP